jgi:hypothetical protein
VTCAGLKIKSIRVSGTTEEITVAKLHLKCPLFMEMNGAGMVKGLTENIKKLVVRWSKCIEM